MKELIQKLNDLKILQTSGDWEEDIPEEIYTEYFENNFREIEEELDVEKHRHYELSTTVIELIEDGHEFLMGIRVISKLYSDMSMFEDVYHYLEFFEMQQVEAITYVRV